MAKALVFEIGSGNLINHSGLVDLAAEALRALILSGELAPGQRVTEIPLAARLGISRPPLREALRILQSEGLLTALPRRGMVVTPLSDQDVWEVMTLRAALERTALELALPLMEPERLLPCKQALAAMQSAASAKDRAAMTTASYQFHFAVVGLAQHKRLTSIYRSLMLQVQLCMAMNVRARERTMGESLRGNVERHRRLLALIEAGECDAVLRELNEHGDRTFMLEKSGFDQEQRQAVEPATRRRRGQR